MTLPNIHTPGRLERFARWSRLWPYLGLIYLGYYAWARREIRPTHPDAPKVGHRYTQLKQEFKHESRRR
jgi:hypothetical protein